jgi:hypothetical protein
MKSVYHDPDMVERIRMRCIECGDCLLWQGAVSKKGAGMYISFGCKRILIRRALWELRHGPIPEGNDRCVRHLLSMTIAERNRRTARDGWFSSPAYRAKISRAKTRKSKLSDEAVARIRAYEGYVPQIAAEEGISEAYAYMLRRGRFRLALDNPFANLGART